MTSGAMKKFIVVICLLLRLYITSEAQHCSAKVRNGKLTSEGNCRNLADNPVINDLDRKLASRQGRWCDVNVNPCKNGGTCNSNLKAPDFYSCICSPGYYGNTCTDQWCDVNVNLCQNGGTCKSGLTAPNFHSCQCAPGYYGDTCSDHLCEVNINPCKNGGTCIPNATAPDFHSCQCPVGYYGNTCEDNVNSSCTANGFYYGNDSRKCYFVVIHGVYDVDHPTGRDLCADAGGIAADILDREHEEAIALHVRSQTPVTVRATEVWFGMSYTPSNSTIRWSNGDEVPKSVAASMIWWPGYPRSGSTYDTILFGVDATRFGLISYFPSYRAHGVVCEISR